MKKVIYKGRTGILKHIDENTYSIPIYVCSFDGIERALCKNEITVLEAKE